MSIVYKTLVGLICTVFIWSLFSSTEPFVQSSPPTPTQEPVLADLYAVESVVDGDTIKVRMGTTTETVRLIGINTPETVHPSKPVECFGREASNKTKELLTGKRVRIERDPSQGERDAYGRLLAYVFLEDGTALNKLLIADGYAYEYTYNTPYQYQKEFKQAQIDARNTKRGLWADDACAPIPVQKKEPQNTSLCDPNYAGACVPIASDVDCAGGSGNGPAYVRGPVSIVGTDIYDLDRDGDGIACEK